MSNWMKQLVKDFGVIAAEMPALSTKVIKMPSPSLNWAVGNGGIAEGKAMCLFGPESGGKSLLMQLILAQIQADDPEAICILFDAEYSFNPEWFAKLGGDLNRLIVRQSNDPLKIFDYIIEDLSEMLQDGAPIRAIAIDSVKSIIYPKDVKEKTTKVVMGGSGAAYLGSALKRILPVIREHNVTTVLVQQIYEQLDEYKKLRNPYVVPDGRSLKFFCDYMLQVEKLETRAGIVTQGKNIHGSDHQIGHKVRVKVKKNRTDAPYRAAQFTLDYNKGIINTGEEVFELAKSLDVIFHPINPDTKKLNTMMWQFADHDAIKGQDNMKQWVIDNPQIQNAIMAACETVSDEAVAKRNEDDVEIDVDLKDL
jgi:protein RecA